MRRLQACSAVMAAIVLLGASWGAACASAAPPVSLQMGFHPDRLGASTTISFEIAIGAPTPLRTLQLRLPAGMGFATATLGFATCDPIIFQLEGAKGCPANSRAGGGSAYAEAPFVKGGQPEDVFETASVSVFFGPIEGRAQTLLFWIEGSSPATYWQPIVAHALPAAPPYGESLNMEIPLLSAAAEGPYVSLRRFEVTIGPEEVTYYLHEDGKAIPFKPRGVSVPDRCPRGGKGAAGQGAGGPGGFPVEASFTWWEGTESSRAVTHVPCPKPRGDAKSKKGRPIRPASRRDERPSRASRAGVTPTRSFRAACSLCRAPRG